MRANSHRFVTAVSLGLCVLAAVLWLEPWSGGESGRPLNVSRTQAFGVSGSREALAREVRLDERPTARRVHAAEGERPSAGEARAASPEGELAVDRPLRGVVLNPLGRPVPGARVVYRPGPRLRAGVEEPDFDGPEARDGSTRSAIFESGVTLDSIEARADGAGRFEISGASTLRGGELLFGHDRFQGQPPTQAVDARALEQRLVLPGRPPETPAVRWRVRDRLSGEPLYPTHVRAFLLRLPVVPQLDPGETGLPLPRRALREPRADQIQRDLGWAHLELWPGTWRVEIATEDTLAESFLVDVPYSGPDLVGQVELLRLTGDDGWKFVGSAAEPDFEPSPDTSNGFDRYRGEQFPPRSLGEARADRAFRHTFRFGVGEVRSAYLELEIEAASSMSYNDFLALEYLGDDKCAFGRRVGVLFDVDWRPPMRQRFLLDLSNVQGREGVLDLRAHMADGRLDFFLQDDTVVHDLRLFVQRDG